MSAVRRLIPLFAICGTPVGDYTEANSRKFFGSFFQERTFFFEKKNQKTFIR
jgi:hypothetical protein